MVAGPEVAPSAQSRNLDSPELYINRELSLLEFQRRVLQEAQDPGNPLLERVKFLAILSSNLDEFFMVRVSALQKQLASGSREPGIDGRSAAAQLELIREQVKSLGSEAQKCLRDELLPALARERIRIPDVSSLSKEERASLDSYFLQYVFPVLTPLAFDPGRPFPHISNRSLNLAVVVGDQDGVEHFARIKVPDTLHQLVSTQSPSGDGKSATLAAAEQSFVWLEQLIAANLDLLVSGNGDRRIVSFPRHSRCGSGHPGIGKRRSAGER